LLDSNGFKVYAGVRREEDAQALREAASNRLTPLMLDVSDGGSIARARRQIAEQTDALAGLVNNAGVVVAGPLEALPMSELRDQFEVNVFGVLALTKAFLPHLRVGRGRIVNVSSINGRIVTPFAAAYGASKFALEGISDGLRMELSPWSIPVSVVQPGATATAIWSTSTQRALDNAGNFDPEMRDRYAGLVAAIERRGGQPPQHAIPPERVAAVIHRALTTRRPRTRYLVGTDARIAAVMAAVLPDRLKDRILTRRSRRRTGADPNDRVETTRPESAP
jgi:NAD(P)-dependent dehydrogenase (short-subunit alcohol dehydrogenase family)